MQPHRGIRIKVMYSQKGLKVTLSSLSKVPPVVKPAGIAQVYFWCLIFLWTLRTIHTAGTNTQPLALPAWQGSRDQTKPSATATQTCYLRIKLTCSHDGSLAQAWPHGTKLHRAGGGGLTVCTMFSASLFLGIACKKEEQSYASAYK